ILSRDAPAAPKSLDPGVDAHAQYWTYSEGSATQKRFSIRAKSFRQIKEPSVVELDDVELQLFHKEGTTFDLVHSAKAQFDMSAKTLFSDGDVEITMGLPSGGAPRGRILKIRSSGVSFQSETGKAATDRKTS